MDHLHHSTPKKSNQKTSKKIRYMFDKLEEAALTTPIRSLALANRLNRADQSQSLALSKMFQSRQLGSLSYDL
jgi:hypothetical protein